MLLTTSLLADSAYARFEFITQNIRDTLVLDDKETIEYRFDVHFKSYDERDNNEAEDYAFAISDSAYENPGYPRWGSFFRPNDPEFSNLDSIIVNTVDLSGTTSFIPGEWSTPIINDQPERHLQVTVKINKAELLRANQNPLRLHLVGADYEAPLYYWTSIRITLDIIQPAEVRIARLSDVTLSEKNLESTVNACAFSSTGKASFYFNGLHGTSAEPFQLSNNANAFIPYQVSMRAKGNGSWQDWKPEEHEGHLQNVIWDISGTTEDCFDNNLDIKIAVDGLDVPSTAGVYSDTMTVTVSPK